MPNNGMAVAEVALTNIDGDSIVGSGDLKFTSKLSYANDVLSVRTASCILHPASRDSDLTVLWILDRLMDRPACASASMTFSGTAVE